jgi:hypothetical protein
MRTRNAAENESYDAFERMLEIASEDACGVSTVHSIGLGPDWNKVNEIAQSDERIAAALRRYDEKIDTNISSMFTSMEEDSPAAAETQPVQSRASGASFFSRLKFW